MDWPIPTSAIGRLANFGALRKTRAKEHNIFETSFGKRNITLPIDKAFSVY